ncbi:hypothetical protein FA13DRAFT_1736705 [Coprinellus micaceus]|uniref:Uncharacterized protein n=1 Tax=Coprinellus micaceus TaxID=71717 RepID=A0A4Y7SZQ2_COPMI|nr:hypothetical protein FA13DRAFT_1736705 [Coprinellus micaceus]
MGHQNLLFTLHLPSYPPPTLALTGAGPRLQCPSGWFPKFYLRPPRNPFNQRDLDSIGFATIISQRPLDASRH